MVEPSVSIAAIEAVEGVSDILDAAKLVSEQLVCRSGRVFRKQETPGSLETVVRSFDALLKIIPTVHSTLEDVKPSLRPAEYSRLNMRLQDMDRKLQLIHQVLNSYSNVIPPTPDSNPKYSVLWLNICRLFFADPVRKQVKWLLKSIKHIEGSMKHLVNKLGEHRLFVSNLRQQLALADCSNAESTSTDSKKQNVVVNANRPHTQEDQLKKKPTQQFPTDCATEIVAVCSESRTYTSIHLTHERRIRENFKHGAYFWTLGMDVNNDHGISEIVEAVSLPGRKILAKNNAKTDLDDAVNFSEWFKDKVVLFIPDDLWPKCPVHHLVKIAADCGYLDTSSMLQSPSSDGHMLISTASNAIVKRTETTVPVTPLFATGMLARVFFCHYAEIPLESFDNDPEKSRFLLGDACKSCANTPTSRLEYQSSVNDILLKCAGVPLSLEVAGRAVHYLRHNDTTNYDTVNTDGKSEYFSAVQLYHQMLCKEDAILLCPSFDQHRSIATTVNTSLRIVEKWMQRRRWDQAEGFATRLYSSFCLLQRKSWLPRSVLEKAWNELDCSQIVAVVDKLNVLGLLYREVDGPNDWKVGLHDLLLDYSTALGNDRYQYEEYHRALLCMYEPERCPAMRDASCLKDSKRMCSIDLCTRPWWTICTGDSYLFENVTWHLREGKLLVELVGLLSNAQWTELQVKTGSVASTMKDFKMISQSLRQGKAQLPGYMPWDRILVDMYLIEQCIRTMWPFIVDDPAQVAPEAFARLLGIENSSLLVDRYLESAESLAVRPWLRPFRRYLPVQCAASVSNFDISCGVVDLGVDWAHEEAIVCTREGQLISVDFATGSLKVENQYTSKFATCVTMTKDGRRAVFGFRDGELIISERNNRTHNMPMCAKHDRSISCVAISADGRGVASGSWDKAVRLWDGHSGRPIGGAMHGHKRCVSSIAISGDARVIASGSYDGTVWVWEAGIGKKIDEGMLDMLYGRVVTIREDGLRIASGSHSGHVQLWDVGLGKKIGEPKCRRGCEEKGAVRSLAFSTDGRVVVSGSRDKTVRMWDGEFGHQIGEPLVGHSECVWCVAVGGDGRRVVSGSLDRSLRLWHIENGHNMGALSRQGIDADCVDDHQAVTSTIEHTVQLWNVENRRPISSPVRGHERAFESSGICEDDGKFVSG